MLISRELAMLCEICYALFAGWAFMWRNVAMFRTKETVVEILMRRDNISQRDAELRVEHCQARIDAAFDTAEMGCSVEDVLREELGLELDYIEAFVPISV